MSLSVCLITNDPVPQIEALLAPLGDIADEVVIAADARVDDATLAGYAELADRLFRIEFRLYEQHLGWLHAQCRGDWVLRLDGDELLSAALVERLPSLLSARGVRQYQVARAWAFPGPGEILDEPPWSDDYLNRLVRNDGTLTFPGGQHQHASPALPAEYVEEPVYHLELLLAAHDERRAKAIRYEVARPHLVASGGGRINEAFYLPELRDEVRTRTPPPEDAAALADALRRAREPAGRASTRPASDVPVVGLDELDSFWAGRAVPASAYRATIDPVDPAPELEAGEMRRLMVRVRNEGTDQWPWGDAAEPPIRLAYRWLHADGSVHASEGLRTPFTRTVGPGDRLLSPLDVLAPTVPGEYLLEVDVVHEDVRWFGCERRIPVAVRAPRRDAGPRLRETPPRRRRALRRLRIPRIIHRVWLGDAPMPEPHRHFGETFRRHHRGWQMRLWTDEDLPSLGIGEEVRARTRTPTELSDLVRYEVLHRMGGLYVDTDVECLRPFTPLLRGVDAFAGLEDVGRAGTAVLGAVPGHPAFARAARESRHTAGLGAHSADSTGPYFLTLLLEQEPGVTLFGADRFYPYRWDEPHRRAASFPGAYAVHHWSLSWWADER